jgi:hypothetical protein
MVGGLAAMAWACLLVVTGMMEDVWCYWERYCNKSRRWRYFWVIRTKICWLGSCWELLVAAMRDIGATTGDVPIKREVEGFVIRMAHTTNIAATGVLSIDRIGIRLNRQGWK